MDLRTEFEAKFPVPDGVFYTDAYGIYISANADCDYQRMWLGYKAAHTSQQAIIDDLRLKLSGKTFSADPVAIEAARQEGFAAGLQAAINKVMKWKKEAEQDGLDDDAYDMQTIIDEFTKLQPTDYKVVKAEEYEALMTFYGVQTITDLIEAQCSHIESLQNKYPKWEPANTTPPRVG